jgi:hypothetical protein
MEEWIISVKFPRMRGVLIQLHWHVWVRLKRGDVWSSWPQFRILRYLALCASIRVRTFSTSAFGSWHSFPSITTAGSERGPYCRISCISSTIRTLMLGSSWAATFSISKAVARHTEQPDESVKISIVSLTGLLHNRKHA